MRIQWLAMVLLVMGGGCLYDESNRCGPNQTFDGASESCICAAGTVLVQNACLPCGAHEESKNGKCVCAMGFERSGSACVVATSAVGTECTGATCADPKFTLCQTAKSGKGYCTAACAANTDCPESYTCATWDARPYCQRSATGFGNTCAGDGDCAGLDADHCQTLQAPYSCVARCSTATPATCGTGFKCCDLSKLGIPGAVPLCLPSAACPVP